MDTMRRDPATRLDEITTNPSSLAKWARTPEAADMVVGFEAEMLVQDLAWEEDRSELADYSEDTNMPRYHEGALDEIEEWFENGNNFAERSTLGRVLRRLDRDYHEYVDETWEDVRGEDKWVKSIRSILADNLGVDEDDPLVDEHMENESSTYRVSARAAKDMWAEEGDAWEDFLSANSIESYRQFCDENNLDWPYSTRDEGGLSPEDLEAGFVRRTGYDCVVSQSYHGRRPSNAFVMEPDSSLSGEDGYGGLELISPPMPLASALQAIDKVFDWMEHIDARTDWHPPTGFHIGVSMRSKGVEEVDRLKLILMMGDEHVLKQFGRERLSRYAASSLKHIRDQLSQPGFNVEAELSKFHSFLDMQAAKDLSAVITGGMRRENTINIRPSMNYIEFRSAGGDYLKQREEIKMAVLRFARVLAIAANPEAEKREYAKKLYQLLTSSLDGKDDAIEAFAAYSSGLMGRDDLQRAIKTYRERKSGGSADGGRTWNVVDERDGRIVGTIFGAENQLASRLRDFSDRNGLPYNYLTAVQSGAKASGQSTFRVQKNFGRNERFDIDAKSPAEALRYAKSRWGELARPDGDYTVTRRG